MAVLVEHGPGSPSVDSRLFPNWKGPFWTAAMLAAATAGSFLIDLASEPAPPEAPAPTPAPA
jgi:putative oxidoreductase